MTEVETHKIDELKTHLFEYLIIYIELIVADYTTATITASSPPQVLVMMVAFLVIAVVVTS